MQQGGKNVDCDGGVGVERLIIFPGTSVNIRKICHLLGNSCIYFYCLNCNDFICVACL